MVAQGLGGAERAQLVERDVEVHRMGTGPALVRLHEVGRVGGDAHDAAGEPRGTGLDGGDGLVDEARGGCRPPAAQTGRGCRAGEVDGVVPGRGQCRSMADVVKA